MFDTAYKQEINGVILSGPCENTITTLFLRIVSIKSNDKSDNFDLSLEYNSNCWPDSGM